METWEADGLLSQRSFFTRSTKSMNRHLVAPLTAQMHQHGQHRE